MNIPGRADVCNYQAFGIGNKMEVSIHKAGDNGFPMAVDNSGMVIFICFPIISFSDGDDFFILDYNPGSLRAERIQGYHIGIDQDKVLT